MKTLTLTHRKCITPFLMVLLFMWQGCSLITTDTRITPPESSEQLSGEALMDSVQYRTFQYFWDGAEPTSGMARERYHVDGEYPQDDKNVVTSGGSGFGLMAILVGIEREFITRAEGLERFEQIAVFLENADRFHGAWPHWMFGESGEVKPFSEKDDGGDLVETAYLVQGMIAVQEYFKNGTEREQELSQKMEDLWHDVEWDWYTKDGEDVLYWHWSPNYGWEMDFPLEGYNEVLITYVLAAASPDHNIDADAYHKGWARGGNIRLEGHEQYGYSLDMAHNYAEQYGGPLFWAHYSYLGLDPRNLEDDYSNYWEHNRNHTLINRQWCIENPNDYEGYGENSWGLTASYSVNGYAAHAPGDGDLGVITPTAALSSMPYTPEESMATMEHFYNELGDRIWGKYGFYDAFSVEDNWYPERYLAIDQGPIVVMIENHRSGLLWDLFMGNEDVQRGLDKLGFQY